MTFTVSGVDAKITYIDTSEETSETDLGPADSRDELVFSFFSNTVGPLYSTTVNEDGLNSVAELFMEASLTRTGRQTGQLCFLLCTCVAASHFIVTRLC